MKMKTLLFRTLIIAAALPLVTVTSPAQAAGKFSVRASGAYSVKPINRRQFNVGSGINFKSGGIPIAGTGKFNCEAGFKNAPQNASLTKAEINELAASAERVTQIKNILGRVFKIHSHRMITVQGYKGIEMTVQPKMGPGAKSTMGMMAMVETPKGRMTQACFTTKDKYQAALPSYRKVTAAITLPE